MAYKKIGRKSPIKPFKNRRKIKLMKRMFNNSLRRGRAELALGQRSQQYCTITESVLIDDIQTNTINYETFTLKSFSRAMQIAPNFKWYRAKKVIYKYEPLFTEFVDGNESAPYYYMIMNRTQDRQAYTGSQLRMQGAVPKLFKNGVTISYKPNWCSQGLGAYTQVPGGPITSINATGLKKEYGWLQTPRYNGSLDVATPIMTNQLIAGNVNPMALYTAQTIYNGHIAYFDQAVPTGSPVVARRTITVVWEFKGPKVDINLTEPEHDTLVYDNSGNRILDSSNNVLTL